MNILHLVSSLNVGGAERFVLDLACAQKTEKNRVSIVSMGSCGEPLEVEAKNNAIEVHHSSKITALRVLFKQADIIHVHSSYCLLRTLLASLGLGAKIIYTRHNEQVHTTLKWRITYWLASMRLSKIIFVGANAQQKYLQYYPEFESKAETILNGVMNMGVNKKSSDFLRIGHVGRFVPLKSQHVLIKAVASLPKEVKQKIEVNFYGNGPLEQENRKLAQQLIPSVHVNFHGLVNQRAKIYEQTDLLVVTSETEGLSLVILEALASGTPIIASEVGGNPELVIPGKNGFLYPYNDHLKLAKYIEKLATDWYLVDHFSTYGRAFFQNNFTMQQCAKHYSTAYQS